MAETPGRTAALVSPDRQLARRVSVRLEAWGLRVDDSAGQSFAKFPLGAFLDLIVEAAATRFQPIALAALLKHPLCRLGLALGDFSRAARALELAVFRAPYFGQGLDGIAAALERAEAETKSGTRRHRAVRALKRADWQAARDLTQALGEGLPPAGNPFRLAGQSRLARIRQSPCGSRRSPRADQQQGVGRCPLGR